MTSMTAHAAAGHDSHHDNPYLAHHYDTPEQQYDAAKFGMWLFIATELLLFGGLFVAYAVYRGNNPELFQYGAQFLSTKMGAINTVVLILSSLTIAVAVRAAQLDQRRMLVTMLALTVLGGGIFMVIKYFEYAEKFEKNLIWGVALYEGLEKDSDEAPAGALVVDDASADAAPAVEDGELVVPRSAIGRAAAGPGGVVPDWELRAAHYKAHEEKEFVHPRYDPDRPENLHHFFGIYFMMTGLHGFHVLVGMVIIGALTVMAAMGKFGSQYFTPIEITGLYWHVVDLIWIFLFPLLYLIH
jgi:cytochrome c oxidase subunit III